MSEYPTLELMSEYGLRTAFLMLMGLARSGTHFQALHKRLEPECRLPRGELIALKNERQRMFGTENRPNAMSDENILAEFSRVRGSANLGYFYAKQLEARTRGNDGRYDRVQGRANLKFPDSTGFACGGFSCRFANCPSEAHVWLERVLDADGHEANRLCVTIRGKGYLEEESIRMLGAAPPWDAFDTTTERNGNGPKNRVPWHHFRYWLDIPVELAVHVEEAVQNDGKLSTDGFVALQAFLANAAAITVLVPKRNAFILY